MTLFKRGIDEVPVRKHGIKAEDKPPLAHISKGDMQSIAIEHHIDITGKSKEELYEMVFGGTK